MGVVLALSIHQHPSTKPVHARNVVFSTLIVLVAFSQVLAIFNPLSRCRHDDAHTKHTDVPPLLTIPNEKQSQ